MFKSDIDIHRNLQIDTKQKFDINVCYSRFMSEFYSLFKCQAPKQIKNQIKSIIVAFSKDEFLMFKILSKRFTEKQYTCPKCGNKDYFIPSRYKQLNKLVETKKFVSVEKPRTLGCQKCSFVFNPLAVGSYRNIKIDLRKWVFYTFISDNGNIDYPISSIAYILDVSYGTAKNIKRCHKTGERKDQEGFGEKFVDGKTEEHPWVKIMLQEYDYLTKE